MNKKMLTIAIPTYNRAELLKNTLENFISQIIKDKLEDLVEIWISDNASNDNTQKVVTELSHKYPNLINYNRNIKNVVWENIKIVAELANTEYVWLCSDDEKYDADVIKHIIEIAQKNIYKFIYLNIDQNFDNNYIKMCNIDKDLECSPSELISRTIISLTTLSCCILRKDVINTIPTKFVTWYHFEKAFNLDNNDKCFIIAKPYIHYDTISTWNTKEKRIKYYTELFSLIMISPQAKIIKDVFLRSSYLRETYMNDILNLLKDSDFSKDLHALGNMLEENCKKGKCKYFKIEISLLKQNYLWYFYFVLYNLSQKIKPFKTILGRRYQE